MQYFDTRQPATLAQIAQFYNSPTRTPEQIDSQLFMDSSQAHGWLRKQAQGLGIDNPVSFFAKQSPQAPVVSGMEAELRRQAGIFDPNSLSGQLAARDKVADAYMQNEREQAMQLAARGTAQRLAKNPLPVPGVAPILTPVQQQDMQYQGVKNPSEYLLRQRLGPNRSSVNLAAGQTSVNAEDLYNEPTFQSALQNYPDKASEVFNSLTGLDLGLYHKGHLANLAEEQKTGITSLREALDKGHATISDDGTLKWRNLVPDATTGKLVLGNDYGPGDHYQQSLARFLPRVSSSLGRFQQLAAKGGEASTVPGVAPLQVGENPVPEVMRADPVMTGGGFMGTAAATAQGILGDLGRTFTGQGDKVTAISPQGVGGQWAYGAGDYSAPGGRAVRHAAPQLRNNPRFQQLMKTDPAAARRIIMAIQQGTLDNNPMSPSDEIDSGAFWPSY